MLSPLRYPGGKAKLFSYFVDLIAQNGLYGFDYAEPYAGGAGLALKLLGHGFVRRVKLNDIDPAISAFWSSVLQDTEQFSKLVSDTPLSVDEWRNQREVYAHGMASGRLALGFSAYYLNRTSRSGIIEGSGPIGGYAQSGDWKIDARFNRQAQLAQIDEIARHGSQIELSCEDALSFVERQLKLADVWVYLDPPYYVKGSKLYRNFYCHTDHVHISNLLRSRRDGRWVLSYDNAAEIVEIHGDFIPTVYNLLYTAGAVGKGQEVIFSGDGIRLPEREGFEVAA